MKLSKNAFYLKCQGSHSAIILNHLKAKQNPGCGEHWGILSTYFEKSLKQHTLGLNKAQLYVQKFLMANICLLSFKKKMDIEYLGNITSVRRI